MKKILIPCPETKSGQHRWKFVRGTYATEINDYVERRCCKCHEYESEIR